VLCALGHIHYLGGETARSQACVRAAAELFEQLGVSDWPDAG